MNSNVNLEPFVGALSFMGACLLLLLSALVAAHALYVRKLGRAGVAALVGFGVAAAYAGVLLAFSLGSAEKVLAGGEEKYFCELDCHLAYSVVSVRRARTLGTQQNAATAGGEFYVMTVSTRFDEQTISPGRGDAPLRPNRRRVAVYDGRGLAYDVSEEGTRALASEGGAGLPLDTPLRPGESYTTGLVFDLPEDVRDPVLLINESALPTRFIIGHENSPLHKKTKFGLGPSHSAER